jgi:hypothetical protein
MVAKDELMNIGEKLITYQLIIDESTSPPVIQSALMTCYVNQDDQKEVIKRINEKYKLKTVGFWENPKQD